MRGKTHAPKASLVCWWGLCQSASVWLGFLNDLSIQRSSQEEAFWGKKWEFYKTDWNSPSQSQRSVAKAVFLQGRAAILWADICSGRRQGSACDCVAWWLAASHPREPFSQSVQLFVFCADRRKWSILRMTTSKHFLKTRVDVRGGSCGVGRGYLWGTPPPLWVTLSAPRLLSTRVHFQRRLLCLTFKTQMHLKIFLTWMKNMWTHEENRM